MSSTTIATATAYLSGAALDWAVAKAEGKPRAYLVGEDFADYHKAGKMRYSTNWSQAGEIIEREKIDTIYDYLRNEWVAYGGTFGMPERTSVHGPAPLIAAMRCHVTRKLGDYIEIPLELS